VTVESIRSLLFAPGSDERKLTRALESDADAMIADLEDAVAPAEKDAARTLVARLLAERAPGPARTVRINGIDTPHFEADLAMVGSLEIDAIVVPKATPEAVSALGHEGPPLIAIVETAGGLRTAFDTACAPRVAALMLGGADLGAELRWEPRPDGLELLYARSQLVVDSAAARIRAPIDVVFFDTRDSAGLEAEATTARTLGLGGKACIHPAQVRIVNRVFSPTADQVAWAERVVDAYDEGVRDGRGAVALEGKMIDLPVVERARRLLAQSGRSDT
jgi:citrate lyase beta subunit